MMLVKTQLNTENDYVFEAKETFTSLANIRKVLDPKERTLIPLGDLFQLSFEDYTFTVHYLWADFGCVELEGTILKGTKKLFWPYPIELSLDEDSTLLDVKHRLIETLHEAITFQLRFPNLNK